ncbi:ribonuclease E/G [Roseovarius sp. SCSIO 43702]|uniref:ribonuclease E/G n=1 Tax=Roseovarius sp. SCSIO 43702 TaxID=2823043 RepID=UPI001C73D72E|nr:ribonuclease E/G [Roseovarius sp. SCSIO 43702]QYX56024.1 ribonuclease E/G [Roseovarius sp. SCSIO 43702]
MSSHTIILDQLDGREAAALLEDGQLADLIVADETVPPVGTIYRATIDRPVKGQGGSFLKIPDGTAFLRQAKGLRPGEPLLVQVSGRAEQGKAVPVTSKLLFKGRYAIVTPDAPGLNISRAIRDEARRDALLELAHDMMGGRPMGLILRSSCEEENDDEAIAEDITAMADVAEKITNEREGAPETLLDGDGPHAFAWREWSMPATVIARAGAFETEGVLDLIDGLRTPRVALGRDGAMWIEPTRALIAVDVNAGSDTSPAAALKVNLAAARDLPRQLRLRGLGGQVTLDLAPMAKKDRKLFESTLRAAFRADRIETALVGWTPLGHFELQRKRERMPLAEILT